MMLLRSVRNRANDSTDQDFEKVAVENVSLLLNSYLRCIKVDLSREKFITQLKIDFAMKRRWS